MGRLRFGPAGKPVSFKGRDIAQVPGFLRSLGLDAFEYEAVRGVSISEAKARRLGEEARKHGVSMSLHAPYYINLAARDRRVLESSKKRLLESLLASEWMGSYVVVFHPGYYKGLGREEALNAVVEAVKSVWEEASSLGVRSTWLGPETTGRTSQVGSVDEVLHICRELPRCRPTVDWAHIYARERGRSVSTPDDVARVVEAIERELGREAIDPLHTHFSRIEYGKGGEVRHHTLSEEGYGPDWMVVCEAYRELGINAVVISESPVLEQDAIVMKRMCGG